MKSLRTKNGNLSCYFGGLCLQKAEDCLAKTANLKKVAPALLCTSDMGCETSHRQTAAPSPPSPSLSPGSAVGQSLCGSGGTRARSSSWLAHAGADAGVAARAAVAALRSFLAQGDGSGVLAPGSGVEAADDRGGGPTVAPCALGHRAAGRRHEVKPACWCSCDGSWWRPRRESGPGSPGSGAW